MVYTDTTPRQLQQRRKVGPLLRRLRAGMAAPEELIDVANVSSAPRAPRGPRPPRVPAAAAAAAAARNGGTGAREISGSTRRFGDAWRAARQEMAGAELVYGIDCPLPPALGAARLVAWYNVNRGEAQAEMRLFDL